MLLTVRSMKELNFSALMEIYRGTNLENGAQQWPGIPEGQQLLQSEQAFYQYLKECFFTAPGAIYYIWMVSGKYVSALRLEPYQNGMLLEALETAPEKREMGYATALIQEMLRAQANLGPVKIYSHVGKRNSASMNTHLSCGFQKILDHAVYADGSVMTNHVTMLYETNE